MRTPMNVDQKRQAKPATPSRNPAATASSDGNPFDPVIVTGRDDGMTREHVEWKRLAADHDHIDRRQPTGHDQQCRDGDRTTLHTQRRMKQDAHRCQHPEQYPADPEGPCVHAAITQDERPNA